MKHQILIVGGGNAGLSTASKLLLKNSKLDIGIIEPSDKHYYQPAWTLVGGGAYNIEDTIRNEADFIPRGATWIKDAVVAAMPHLKCVVRRATTQFSPVPLLRRRLLTVLLTTILPAVLVEAEMFTPAAMVLLLLLCLKRKDN